MLESMMKYKIRNESECTQEAGTQTTSSCKKEEDRGIGSWPLLNKWPKTLQWTLLT